MIAVTWVPSDCRKYKLANIDVQAVVYSISSEVNVILLDPQNHEKRHNPSLLAFMGHCFSTTRSNKNQ